jgi:alanine dehydrogenase
MARLLKDEDIASLAPMSEIVDAIEAAYIDHAKGFAPFYPRRTALGMKGEAGKQKYSLTTQIGGSAALGVMAVRLMSHVSTISRRGEKARPGEDGFSGKNWGVTVLFDVNSSELLGVLPQFTMSGLRVGANTGLAAKWLARKDAQSVGVFGSSKVARADLEGIAYARKLKTVKIYSPNPDHRDDFAREMEKKIGVEIIPVDDPKKAVEGMDIVSVSTNSHQPVFKGEWLVAGQYVSTTMSTPYPRQPLSPSWKRLYTDPEPLPGMETDDETLKRADVIAILNREMILNENQREYLDLIDSGVLTWDKFVELGDVAAGLTPGRRSDKDLVVYKSSGGMGLQMAAIGSVVLRNAKKRGVGQEISGDWFSADMSDWHAKGFTPSQ